MHKNFTLVLLTHTYNYTAIIEKIYYKFELKNNKHLFLGLNFKNKTQKLNLINIIN